MFSMPRALPVQLTGPVVAVLARFGVTPNMLTIGQLVGGIGAAALIAGGELVWGAIALALSASLDAFDGALARSTGQASRFGGVLDSVVDRLFEGAILGGMLFHLLEMGEKTDSMLVLVGAVGSICVSYVRARAQAEGVELLEGLFTRPVRLALLFVGLVLDQLTAMLWVLAIMTILTTVQRLLIVWLKLQGRPESDGGGL
jgi:CDP-diacylglycerol--glycerol-3-phosphate 3-phosphatidyltransferase